MKRGAGKEGQAGPLMHSERHLDPSKACAQLKEDEQEIKDAEKQDDRYPIDVHLENPSNLFFHRDLYSCRSHASVNIAIRFGSDLQILKDGCLDLSGEDLCLRSLS